MKSMKWTLLLMAGVALGFAGGVYAAAAKKEMVVTPAADVKFQLFDQKHPDGPQWAVLFGDIQAKGKPIGLLLKNPAGLVSGAHTHTSDDYAVVIKGTMHNWEGDNEGPGLTPGSTWHQPGKQVHNNHCEPGGDCEIFVYLPNGFDFLPAAGTAPAGGEKPAK